MTTITAVDSMGNAYLTAPEQVTEVLPGLLYQSGRIGHFGDIRSQAPITAIIDVSRSSSAEPKVAPNEPWFAYLHWPIFDGMAPGEYNELPPLPTLVAVASFIVDLIRAGHCVLVHCKGGRNRSSLVIAMAMLKMATEEETGASIVDFIEAKRAGTFTNKLFRDFVTAQGKLGSFELEAMAG